MKQHRFLFVITLTLSTVFLTSCKKSNSKVELDAQEVQFSVDANRYQYELNQADLDIIKSLGKLPAFGDTIPPDTLLHYTICGVSIDSSQLLQKIVKLNFDGVSSCDMPFPTRSGQIKVELTNGIYWNDSNAELTLTYINFKITFAGDNQSMTLNGVRKLKNINGINWTSFIDGTSTIKFSIRGFNISVKNEGNSTNTLNVAGITELNYLKPYANPEIEWYHFSFTNNGDTLINGYNSVNSWGTNRYGHNFVSYNKAPIISNTWCGLYRFKSGEIIQEVNGVDFTIDYGFNNFASATCTEQYQITWLDGSTPHSSLFDYK